MTNQETGAPDLSSDAATIENITKHLPKLDAKELSALHTLVMMCVKRAEQSPDVARDILRRLPKERTR